MTKDTGNDGNISRDEETMSRLLRLAGPRATVSSEVEARVYAKVRAEWERNTAAAPADRVYRNVRREWSRESVRSAFMRWVLPVALAASIAVVISIVVQQTPAPIGVAPVGTIAKVTGPGNLPAPGDEVYPGTRLSTGADEGISLILANAESLRLGANTVIDVLAADRFGLANGRIYADTGDMMYRSKQLVIETAVGEITDVGTQFAVSVAGEELEVAVREGRVDLAHGSAIHVAVAGEKMRLAQGARPEYEEIAADDEYWDWASSLAPDFDIENRSLLDFLRWAARESGHELVFADQELRMSAMRTDLHGSVAGFGPLEAVRSVLATTSFKYRIEPGRIIIEK